MCVFSGGTPRGREGREGGWRVKVKSRQIMKVELGFKTKIRKRRKRQGAEENYTEM